MIGPYAAPLTLALALTPAAGTSTAGTTNLFALSIQRSASSSTGTLVDTDPGKEHLRFKPATENTDCFVSDYDDSRAKPLPRDRNSHEGAVIQGLPLLGPLYAASSDAENRMSKLSLNRCYFGRSI
jgi:hypothetical protein